MSGLEQVGIPGSDALREALTSCTDPIAAIEEFQLQNGILLPSLRPALPFLDLHDMRRLEFHQSVMDELRDKLISRIAELSASDEENRFEKLTDLLGKSFPVIKNKQLQPVVMTLLKHIPNISSEYLDFILDDKQLYSECAIEVKRQLWENNQTLFGDEVSPLLTQYIAQKEVVLLNLDNSSSSFFSLNPKTRRQHETIQKLVSMVGKNVKLYEMLLNFLRTLFLRTRNTNYCTLRAEILMALHDGEVHEICSIDPCYKFAWCLDACIRERFVDSKRSRELQFFLDNTTKKGEDYVLGHLSMILADPYALHTIGISLMKTLQHCANNDTLPRDNNDLILFLRMMSLGLDAWELVDSQQSTEPKLESILIVRYLPCILTLMVDEQIIQTISKFGPDEPIPLLTSVPEYLTSFIKRSLLGSHIAMHYTLQTARQKNKMALTRILPNLLKCENDCALEDTFLHTLVSYLINMGDEFAHEDFCIIIFDDFFMPSISKENVMRHLLRLLYYVHNKLPGNRLDHLMTIIEPGNEHGEAVHLTYNTVQTKINTYVPSPTPEPEGIDSPLMSVPAPTPRV